MKTNKKLACSMVLDHGGAGITTCRYKAHGIYFVDGAVRRRLCKRHAQMIAKRGRLIALLGPCVAEGAA